jgi:hypothetical protein
MSMFLFDDDGLIQDYEDFFDPDWLTRNNVALNPLLTQQQQ